MTLRKLRYLAGVGRGLKVNSCLSGVILVPHILCIVVNEELYVHLKL